jgi:peptide/nickel transport system ATP-binding protein
MISAWLPRWRTRIGDVRRPQGRGPASARDLFARPRHPYTQGLLGAVPKLGSSLAATGRSRLAEIPGIVPNLKQPIIGCAFASRCPAVTDLCRAVAPAVEAKAPGHFVACHHAPREAVAA